MKFMKLAGIDLLAFDLFGVIFPEGHMIRNVLHPMISDFCEYETIKKFYHPHARGDLKEEDFWKGINISDYSHIRKKFLDSFVVDKEFESVKKRLEAKFQLGILSNLSKEWGDYILKKFKFHKTFKPIVISSDVGVSKPDRKIYDFFIQMSGHLSSKIAFVDDRKENLKSAAEVGMRTIWFKREDDDYEFSPDEEIKSFSDILNI
jgi:FMN phosphatase YigB (HAD superfamily)